MIFIASDHGGVSLKAKIIAHLKKRKVAVKNLGVDKETPVDYPDVAKKLSKKIISAKARGILVCRSGIGMSIAANRFKKIRAALCMTKKMAIMSRKHNDANVLVLGADHVSMKTLLSIVDAWLVTSFEGNIKEGARHKRRVEKLSRL